MCELLPGSDIVTVGPTNGLQSTDGRAGRRDFWVTLTSYVYNDLFIGLESDRCLALSLAHWLTALSHSYLVDLSNQGQVHFFSVLKRKREGPDKKWHLEIVFIEISPAASCSLKVHILQSQYQHGNMNNSSNHTQMVPQYWCKGKVWKQKLLL